MRTLYAVLESEYVNYDSKWEFEVDDDASATEIREAAEDIIQQHLCWHVEDEDDKEIELYE
jgi:hypothetical protein